MKIQIKRGKNIDFPSQSKMFFIPTTAIASDGLTTLGKLNIPYALSILNRKSYQQTTTEGVPLVYRCRVRYYTHNEDAAALSNSSDHVKHGMNIDFSGCQNNWTVKNAAVKWHAARQAMWKASGVTRKMRGAYSDAIRYGLTSTPSGDVASDYYLKPMDGDGNLFDGGTWDITAFTHEDDTNFALYLTGNLKDEDANDGANSVNMIGSYLQSRINQKEDTNIESNETPAQFNYLRQVLQLGLGAEVDEAKLVTATAKTEGDNPPYQAYDDTSETQHDISEAVRLARLNTNGGVVAETVMDIPFGLTDMVGRHTGEQTGSTGLLEVDLLNVYEMQG